MEYENIPVNIGKDAELLNEGIIKNLQIEDIEFPENTELLINGEKHRLILLAMQEYPFPEGSVQPHQEKTRVTEAYFPLFGEVDVVLENPPLPQAAEGPRQMAPIPFKGNFSKEQILKAKINLLLNGKDPVLQIITDNGNSYLIPPTKLPSGRHHATSSTGKPAGFIAIKAEKMQ